MARDIHAHSFGRVPTISQPRSTFDRSHRHLTTIDASYLYPIFRDFVIPGDTAACNFQGFARLNTPVTPIMDNLYMSTFFFFVPMRQIWSNWYKFFGGQDDPGDSIDYSIPVVTTPGGGYTADTLYDYLGIPPGVAGINDISALYSRAYNHIWNHWFRDENLQDSVVVDVDDGPDTDTDYVLLKRGKRHDYFTGALKSPQKGTAVNVPVGTTAPVVYDTISGTDRSDKYANAYADAGPTYKFTYTSTYNTGGTNIDASSEHSLAADLAEASGLTVGALRLAFQTQKLLERDSRAGTRYSEIVQSHYGVTMQDIMYKPQYLGGGRSPVHIHPIAQTSETNTTELGSLAAMGTASPGNQGFMASFQEHGVLIGLICVNGQLSYQQGIDRFFHDSSRYDIYHPIFQNLGEQSILNQEIYAQGSGSPGDDDEVFAYQEAWAHYRYKPSILSSRMRSGHANTLDVWHLSEEFGSKPSFNAAFIVDATPLDRVVYTPAEPHFTLDCWFDYKMARPMPVYSIPGMIDHF